MIWWTQRTEGGSGRDINPLVSPNIQSAFDFLINSYGRGGDQPIISCLLHENGRWIHIRMDCVTNDDFIMCISAWRYSGLAHPPLVPGMMIFRCWQDQIALNKMASGHGGDMSQGRPAHGRFGGGPWGRARTGYQLDSGRMLKKPQIKSTDEGGRGIFWWKERSF